MNSLKFLKSLFTLGALSLALGGSQLSAGLLYEDLLDYSNGSIGGQNGGTGFPAAWASSGGTNVDVSNGAVTVAAHKQQSATRALQTAGSLSLDSTTNPTFYFSYEITAVGSVAKLPNNPSVTDGIFFRNGAVPVFAVGVQYSDADSGARIRAEIREWKDPVGTEDRKSQSNARGLVSGMASATTYKVVGEFTFDNGSGQSVLNVWINPESQSSTPTLSYTYETVFNSVTSIQIARYIGDGSPIDTHATQFDNLRVATDWESAAFGAIPEPASASVLAGATGLAFVVTRRRGR